jgi:hypothetical protein
MTEVQRKEFEDALRELDACEEHRADRSARAGYVADALRILSARLDEIDRRLDNVSRTASSARVRSRAVGGRP